MYFRHRTSYVDYKAQLPGCELNELKKKSLMCTYLILVKKKKIIRIKNAQTFEQ